MHCFTACGEWVVERLPYTASLLEGSGQCNSCNAVAHCLGAYGIGTPAMHFGSGQWNSYKALPHYLVGRGTRTLAMHFLTA